MELGTQLRDLPEAVDDRFGNNSLFLGLQEHKIQYMVPPHSMVRGEVLLAGGAVIFGTFCGRLICAQGSVIIKKGAIFEGELEADQVFVDGAVRAVSGPTAALIGLLGRTTPAAVNPVATGLISAFNSKLVEGGLSRLVGRHSLAISNAAEGKADVASRNFAVHGRGFAARYVPF